MGVAQASKLRQSAKQKALLATSKDPVRAQFDVGLAEGMVIESDALLSPAEPLQMGSGGEIVPPYELGLKTIWIGISP